MQVPLLTQDLNFLTIHGKSRYPGLHIWARNTGKRLVASVPDGCLCTSPCSHRSPQTSPLTYPILHCSGPGRQAA